MASEPTTKRQVAHCGIYETRPEVCRAYPKIDHYMPEECTYAFVGNERRGSCECRVGSCCNTPREGGKPGGTPLPFLAGGMPCEHLVWEDAPAEKTASEFVIVSGVPVDLSELTGGSDDS
jgi:hypothetical protein